MGAAGAALAAAALGLAAACGGAGDGGAGPTWPEGTVLAVDGLPLTAAEVGTVAGWIGLVEPTATAPERRRRALTMHLFPKLALDARWPAERERARAEAERTLAAARAGEAPADRVAAMTGVWDTLGIEVWAALRDASRGEWTGPIAGQGRFVVARWLERAPGRSAAAEHFDVELLSFPFVPLDTDRDAAAALTWDADLTIVDPEWERAVPLAWRANMNATPAAPAAGGSPE